MRLITEEIVVAETSLDNAVNHPAFDDLREYLISDNIKWLLRSLTYTFPYFIVSYNANNN